MPIEYNTGDVATPELQTDIPDIIKMVQESKMPQWWLDYADQISYNLQVHTKGLMLDKITGLYPNEHPDSQKHCINSYESITKGSIWKAINNIIRVFNNSSYNIQISDATRKIIEDYQDSEGSLFSQFLEDWIKYAIATDPNGICVTYPPEYTQDLYRYVCHKDILKMDAEVLIFISEQESEIRHEFRTEEFCRESFVDFEYSERGQRNTRCFTMRTYNRRLEVNYINKVYHVFTKTFFLRLYKVDPGDAQFEYEFYNLDIPTLPYFENGGIEVEKDIYESFVQQFVPFGNLSLMSHRNQRAIELMHAYPKMSEVQQPCDECHGSGRVECLDSATGWQTCKSCNGSKYVTIQSPYKVYRKVADSFDTDGRVFSTPSVEYYTPPVEPMKFTNDQWASYLRKAEEAVFVQQKVETGNVQSADSKSIDREELYSWLANIAKVLYGNLEMFLQYLENYVNKNPIDASVEQPYSYAILTESEAFDALNIMLNSPAPVLLKANQIDNFVNKFISESSPVQRALQILKKFDLLLYYSGDDVLKLKGQNIVSPKMVQNHTLAYPVLIQMYELNPSLFDLTDEQIIPKLQAEIDKYDTTGNLQTRLLQNA